MDRRAFLLEKGANFVRFLQQNRPSGVLSTILCTTSLEEAADRAVAQLLGEVQARGLPEMVAVVMANLTPQTGTEAAVRDKVSRYLVTFVDAVAEP